MTIAACYLSSEGVVFGADSTSTIYVAGMRSSTPPLMHHYNFAQKIFQVGENSTLGITMWGLGNLGAVSYRTLIARFADSITQDRPQSLHDVAERWNDFFWNGYSTSSELEQFLRRARDLHQKPARTLEEDEELSGLRSALSGGFCIGGYMAHDRTPGAIQILYDPTLSSPGPVDLLAPGSTRFWGCPNLVNRLRLGIDESLLASIIESGKWSGTQQELFDLISAYCLGQPNELPVREAIDWIHASIYTTIKMMKLSHLAPVCGGPVEIAVITTDRTFRWVRHKKFDAAIGEEGLSHAYQ